MSDEPEVRELTLVSPDGESTEVVQVGPTFPGQGRIGELLAEGYSFDPQHNDEEIEVYGVMPGSQGETRGVVRVGELDQLRRWHEHNYNRDIVVTEDDDDANQALREQEYADERRRRIDTYARENAGEAIAYGALNAVTAGMFAPTARLVGELTDSPEFGRRISEITEASPVAAFAGTAAGGLGLATIGRRTVQAIASRVAPGASRSFSRTVANALSTRPRTALATQSLAEEIYYNSAMSSLQEQPSLSGESIVAGTAFGMMLGLPFVRGTGASAMRGVTPQTPAQQVVSAGRQQADRPMDIATNVPTTAQQPPTRVETVQKLFSGNSVERLRQFNDPSVQHNLQFMAQPGAVDNITNEVGDLLDATLNQAQQVRAPLRSIEGARQFFDPQIAAHTAATSADDLTNSMARLRSELDNTMAQIEGMRTNSYAGILVDNATHKRIEDALTLTRKNLRSFDASPTGVNQAHRELHKARQTLHNYIEQSGAKSRGIRDAYDELIGRKPSSFFERSLAGDLGTNLFGKEAQQFYVRRNETLAKMATAEEWFLNPDGAGLGLKNVGGNRFIDSSKLRRKLDNKDDAVTEDFISQFETQFDALEQGMKEILGAGNALPSQSRRALDRLTDYVNLMKTRRLDLDVRRTSQANTQTYGIVSAPTGLGVSGLITLGFGLSGSSLAFPMAAGMFVAASLARPGRYAAFKARMRTIMADAIGTSNTRTASALSKVKKKLKATTRRQSLGSTSGVVGTGRALAAVGFGRLVTGTPEERANEYHAIQAELRELASNPQLLSEHLSLATAGVSEISEDVADAMNQTAVRGLQYLVQNSPPVANDPLFPGRMAAPPSQSAIDDFVMRYRAIHDPTKLLRDFANNTLSQATVDTVRNVYPEIFNSYQVAMSELLTEINPGTLPYQTRMSLSTFLGSRTDVTLSSDFVMSMQGRAAQTPQQASAQGMERMPARRINVSTSFLTEGQSLESMK